MERIWGQFNDNTAVLLTLFVILMSGFLITRLTNVLRMPRVSGYIIAGIVIGPCVLHLVPGGMASENSLKRMRCGEPAGKSCGLRSVRHWRQARL